MGNFLSGPQTTVATGGAPLVRPDELDGELEPYWDQVCRLLPAGIAAAGDTMLVVQLCEALYVQRQAWIQIVSDGIETEDKAHGGDKRRSPAVITWRQAADAARQCMNMLGMSPVSRSRLEAAAQPQDDPFTAYLRRRHGPAE